jgi:hypothetical protein
MLEEVSKTLYFILNIFDFLLWMKKLIFYSPPDFSGLGVLKKISGKIWKNVGSKKIVEKLLENFDAEKMMRKKLMSKSHISYPLAYP